MIEYKKANRITDLVVAEANEQAMIRHKDCESQAWLCLKLKDFERL